MTKKEILEAAFRVWGADFYLKTSLSELAAVLGVTKPALYRHFSGKDELLKAMFEDYATRLTAFIKPFSVTPPPPPEQKTEGPRILKFALKFAEFYAANRDCFIFSMIHVYGNEEYESVIFNRLTGTGLDGGAYTDARSSLKVEFALSSIIFMVASFHKNKGCKQADGTGESVQEFLQRTECAIGRGMGFSAEKTACLDWESIEQTVMKTPFTKNNAPDAIKAAIKVIASKGPWNSTMKEVAEELGLSKSTLYSHFKNKNEMIYKIFLNEVLSIICFARTHIAKYNTNEERLYCAVFSIFYYLRENSDILLALDHLRTRRPDAKKHAKQRFQFDTIFETIKNADGKALVNEQRAEWLLFIVVNVLMRRSKTTPFSAIPNSVFRTVYRCIALGLEGESILLS